MRDVRVLTSAGELGLSGPASRSKARRWPRDNAARVKNEKEGALFAEENQNPRDQRQDGKEDGRAAQ